MPGPEVDQRPRDLLVETWRTVVTAVGGIAVVAGASMLEPECLEDLGRQVVHA